MKEEQQGNLTHEKEQISEETDDSESEPWYYKPVAQTNEACGEPLAGKTAESFSGSEKSKQSGSDIGTLLCHVATNNLLYGRPSDDPMEDLHVNVAI